MKTINLQDSDYKSDKRYYEYPEKKLERTEKAKELFEENIEKYRIQYENLL
jgi:hypothetical protein